MVNREVGIFLGVNESSDLIPERVNQITESSPASYEWKYFEKGEYGCFCNEAMKVYLQTSDGNYEDGYMTAGPEDRHNGFRMTQDINTGR